MATVPQLHIKGCIPERQHFEDSRFKILYSHKPMHYNGTEIDTNIQYQYLHAHDKMMDVTQ
jgi:hypothetical protein